MQSAQPGATNWTQTNYASANSNEIGTTAVKVLSANPARRAYRITNTTGSAVTFYEGPSTVTNSGSTRGLPIVGNQTAPYIPIANGVFAGDVYLIASATGGSVLVEEFY